MTVFFRGREIVHKDRGLSILERVIADTKDVGKVEQVPVLSLLLVLQLQILALHLLLQQSQP